MSVDATLNSVFHWADRAGNAVNRSVDGIVHAVDATGESLGKVFTSAVANDHHHLEVTHSYNGSWSLGINRHWAKVTGVTVMLGVSGVVLRRFIGKRKAKRRAERLPNGARKDVILIVGSVTEPLTRYIAHDLSTRGFFVYVTALDANVEHKFFQESEDVKSLVLSIDDDSFNAEQIRKFDHILSSDHVPFAGATPNKLNLVGMVFVPELYYPTGKFDTILPQTWRQTVLQNAMFPLNLLTNGLISMAQKYDSNLVFLTPTITASLDLPFHSPENVTTRLIQSLSHQLATDYDTLNITNMKMGMLSITQSTQRKNLGIKGSHVRELHHKLFDLLHADNNSECVYVGFAARVLDHGGSWVPHWVLRAWWGTSVLLKRLVSKRW